VELDVYRLNISGLTLSGVMIAMFFAVLWRSNRRAELRWWTYAWVANVAAVMITGAFWYFEPPPSAFGLVFAVYLAAKCVYVWLHVRGAFEFLGRWPRPVESRQVVPVIAGICVVAIFVITTRDRLGLVSHFIIAAGFAAGTIGLLRSGTPGSGWLAVAFVSRALLAAAAVAAYSVNLTGGGSEAMFAVAANWVFAAHYSLDIGVQWLLAMAMVVAIDARAQRELEAANSQMVEAQAGLRRLVDRDPLTGLANRRALPEVLRSVQPEGALLIFFDLDDFKKINDEHGHQAGDECLARFATALAQCFRPSDAVIRYGGDEFLVVAGISETAVYERTDAVRSRVGAGSDGALRIRFSVGMSRLPAGGNPEQALREADEAMYRSKRRRPARRRAANEVAQQLPLG
jgi:diguanylate cyclase (GGDEF)-like protein